jgi:hypothetical protein
MGITCGRSTSKMTIAGLTTGHEKDIGNKTKEQFGSNKKKILVILSQSLTFVIFSMADEDYN